jgi:sialate O-acetylesterase
MPGRPLSLTGVAAVVALLAARPAQAIAQAAPLLDPLFQDHAVLQRDRPIRVWGMARPSERVTVRIDEQLVTATADASGRWTAELPPMRAGGPHKLEAIAASGPRAGASDILIGDVWLCSGQSNMALPVSRTVNAEAEIARSANDSIRLLTIAQAKSARPLAAFQSPIAWRTATPQSVRDFSGTCYYFARELMKTTRVPMGLIHASWPGSNIETWIGESGLRSVGGFDETLDVMRIYAGDSIAGNRRFGQMWESWWRTSHGSSPWSDDPTTAPGWRDAPDEMRDWRKWDVPELANHVGMVWFARTMSLTPEQARQGSAVSLGGIDEVDETWANGRAVGNTFGYGTERTYRLPAGALHAGDNVVVVNVLNTWEAGGMTGPASHVQLRFDDGSHLPLGGGWRYQIVPSGTAFPPRAPWDAVGGQTALYNGMIAPLGAYGLRGVVWYQGETNTGAADKYQALLAGLMRDWRGRFGDALPFLIVQLPNYGTVPKMPVESGWAALREAQRRAVAADRFAGLAVTIDLGESADLHPPNKQDVGVRLARAARHVVYGEPITPSGPVVSTAQRVGARVVVSFRDVDGQLLAHGGEGLVGFELCGAAKGSCKAANATLESGGVALELGGDWSPTRVRYCWGDSPVCNLYDRAGLPAGPFEVPIGR